LEADRVAEYLARERRVGIGDRQGVVQPAPVPEVRAVVVLVVAALRNCVMAALLLVDRGRAQQVRVPRELARDPAVRRSEVGPREPRRPRTLACGHRLRGAAVLRDEGPYPLGV